MLQHSQDLTQTSKSQIPATKPQEINKALKLAVLGLLGANAHAADYFTPGSNY